jgi:hypothetical protein
MSEITRENAEIQVDIDRAEAALDRLDEGRRDEYGLKPADRLAVASVRANLAQARAMMAIASRMILLADSITELPGKLAAELCADGWVTAIATLGDEVSGLVDAVGLKK